MYCTLTPDAAALSASAAAHLLPLRARPAQLRNPAIHGLRHAAHGVSVLVVLLLQPAIGDPLIEGFRVHELLVAPPHHGVEVVSRVLLPELAQHQLLVARLDALHEAVGARELARRASGVIGGSSGSSGSGSATGPGTAAAGRSASAEAAGAVAVAAKLRARY